MRNIDKKQIRADIARRKAMPNFGISPDTNISRLKTIQETQRSFNLEVVETLLDELEAKDKLNAELLEKHRLIDICQGQGLEHRIAAEKRAEAAEKRIAELEAIAKSVKFDPIPMEDLGNKNDGKKHPYMFGAGYNSAVVHCESVLLRAFTATDSKGTAK